MAEYVHQRMEEMLPEVEEMNRAGLFTVKETKIILKKREGFEYRLRQKTKTKVSFLNYIEYEKRLLELLKVRRIKYGIDPKKRDIETVVIDRIQNLYRLLTTRFQEDVSLWEQHIEFCKETGQLSYVTRLYEKILKLHSHREDIWIKAARFERSPTGNGNPEVARELLLKGHRVNPESEGMFLEIYHMELELASQILKRKKILGVSKPKDADVEMESDGEEGESPEKEEFKLARIVYKKALELFPRQAKFHMKMFNVCSHFKAARSTLDAMSDELKQLYPDNPLVWNGLALRYLTKIKKMPKSKQPIAINKCVDVYKEALSKISNERMWSYCLWGLLGVIEFQPVNASEIMTLTLGMFENAITDGMLTDELFLVLVDLLKSLDQPDDAERVSIQGVERYPSSPTLWMTRLRQMVERAVSTDDFLATFRMALKKVPSQVSWDIWQFGLQYFSSQAKTDVLEEIMEEACRCVTPEVCQPAKEWCLTWTYRQGGIKKVRTIYRSLKSMRPITVELYRRYIQMECSQIEVNLTLIRGAFEECLTQFGKENGGVWLNYMEMEKSVAMEAQKSGQLQQRAMHALNPEVKESFLRHLTMTGVAA